MGDLNSTPVTVRHPLISPTSRLAWLSPAVYSHYSENPFPVSKATETWYTLSASSASCKNVWSYAFTNCVVLHWEQGQIYVLIFEYSNTCSNIILTFSELNISDRESSVSVHVTCWIQATNAWPFSNQFHSCNLSDFKVSWYSARVSCIFCSSVCDLFIYVLSSS